MKLVFIKQGASIQVIISWSRNYNHNSDCRSQTPGTWL